MESLKIKCPDCTGITEIARWKTQGICQYCGSVLDTGRSKNTNNSNSETSIEKEVSLEQTEAVLVDESVFVALARVDALYFDEGRAFEQVLETYADLEGRGAYGYEFWLSRARFFAKGNIAEFEAGRMPSDACKLIVEQYILWMDQAIRDYVGNSTPLKMEKEKTIGEINNTFEGHKKRKDIENQAKELSEEQRRTDAINDADLAIEEMEEALSKKKKRTIIMIIVGVILVLIMALIIRACSSDSEADVTYYEKFLELEYLLELFDDGATRADILELNIDFGTRNTEASSIRLTVPENADLDRLTFYFCEDDLLTRIVINHANHFNGLLAEDGLDQDFFAAFDVDELDETDDELKAIIDDYRVFIRSRGTDPNQFNIEILSSEEELTSEQHAVWTQIEQRIEDGYGSWGDLIRWAYEHDIPVVLLEDEQPPIEAIDLLINRYGVVGDYINATPWQTDEDSEEVVLALHFENLTYNETIAELYNLNRNSNRELNAWLEMGGGGQLDYHFNAVEIVDLDDEGEVLTERTDAIEFVEWEITHIDLFEAVGFGRIRIERHYRILEVETEPTEPTEAPTEPEAEPTEPPADETGTTILSEGSWTVGTDIPQGRFVISGDGVGYLAVWRGNNLQVNETLGGGATGVNTVTTYLLAGDQIVITGINNVTFVPAPNRTLSNTLGTGSFIAGLDIPVGEFYVTTASGSGRLIIWRGDDLVINEILQDGSFSEGEERIQVNLVIGDIITISGLDQVVFE